MLVPWENKLQSAPSRGSPIKRGSHQAIRKKICCPSMSCCKGPHALPHTTQSAIPVCCRHKWPLSTLRMGCHTMQLHMVLLPMKAPWNICCAREMPTRRRMHRYVLPDRTTWKCDCWRECVMVFSCMAWCLMSLTCFGSPALL